MIEIIRHIHLSLYCYIYSTNNIQWGEVYIMFQWWIEGRTDTGFLLNSELFPRMWYTFSLYCTWIFCNHRYYNFNFCVLNWWGIVRMKYTICFYLDDISFQYCQIFLTWEANYKLPFWEKVKLSIVFPFHSREFDSGP